MATSTRSAALDRLLERHRIEAEQLRKKLGDPATFTAAFVRATFEPDELESAFQYLTNGGSIFVDEDDDDEEPNGR